jgi:hypothetical protein
MSRAYPVSELFGTLRTALGTANYGSAHPVAQLETGGTPMSALASDWLVLHAEAPNASNRAKYSREEEFLAALDSYIAKYAEDQKRKSEEIFNEQVGQQPSRFTRWLAALRAILAFSQDLDVVPAKKRN